MLQTPLTKVIICIKFLLLFQDVYILLITFYKFNANSFNEQLRLCQGLFPSFLSKSVLRIIFVEQTDGNCAISKFQELPVLELTSTVFGVKNVQLKEQ